MASGVAAGWLSAGSRSRRQLSPLTHSAALRAAPPLRAQHLRVNGGKLI